LSKDRSAAAEGCARIGIATADPLCRAVKSPRRGTELLHLFRIQSAPPRRASSSKGRVDLARRFANVLVLSLDE